MSSTMRGGQRVEHDVYATPTFAVHRLLDALAKDEFPITDWTGDWCEPCAGNGNIIRAVNTWQPSSDVFFREDWRSRRWWAAEIRADAEHDLLAIRPTIKAIEICDFLHSTLTTPPGRNNGKVYDVILTNPPFALAMEFVQKCRSLATHTIMLLRLGFLGSEERSAFIRETTPDLWILPNRCEFVMSVSCGAEPSCKYKAMLPFTAERPKKCQCGGPIKVVTADSSEYTWMHWHQNSTGRYTMLDSTSVEDRKKR